VVEAARLAVVVEADTKALDAGLKQASQNVSSFGEHVGGIGKTLGTALTVGAVAGTAALAGGFAVAVSAASGFEKQMSEVAAVSGATGSQMKSVADLALQLGKDTSFSASEAASGITELIKGGLSIPDVMNGAAKSMLDLAAAGGVSLPDAATIAANALAQFNLKGEDMAHVADLIAGAANASALDVGQFKFSLQAAGAVASTVGFSFDDLAQAIAVMGKAGIVGSDAGTSLKTMMMNLTPSTDKAAKLMKELGIITEAGANQFFDATGKVRSMDQVAQILQTSLRGLTEEQKLSTLSTLFGSDAIRAAAVLAKEGSIGFQEMAASMGKVAAADVARVRLDNLAGSFEQLKGSIETAAITLGLALLPALRGVVDGATGFVNKLIPVFETMGPKIADVLGQLGARFTTFFGALATGESLAATVNRALGDLIPAGLNPLLDAVDAAFKRVKETVGGLVALIQGGGLAGLWAAVQQAMSDFAPTGERVSSAIQAIAAEIGKLVPEPVKTFVADLLGMAQGAAANESPMRTLANVVNAVSAAVATAVDWLKQNEVVLYAVAGAAAAVAAALVIQQGVQLAVTVATTAMTAAQWLLNAALSANPIGLVVLALGALVGALVYAYKTNEDFRKVVDEVWAFVKETIPTVIEVVRDFLGRLMLTLGEAGATMRTLAGTAASAFEAIRSTIAAAWLAVSTNTTDTWNAISGFLGPLWATMQKAVEDVSRAIQTAVSTAWSAVERDITTAIGNAKTAVDTALGAIKTAFETVQTAIATIVGNIKRTVEDTFGGLVKTANDAKDTMKGIYDTVKGWLDGIKDMLKTAGGLFANRPSGGGGGGAPAAPSAPGMPSGEPPAPAPSGPTPGILRPVGPQMSAMGFASQTTVIQIVLPAGLMVGTAAEVARILQPELARVVSVTR
jgi:TP901 family phage tail tape measure protein